MNTIIYYYSFLGSTRTYATWLAEELGAELFLLRDFRQDQLSGIENVVVTSGTYAGQMPLIRFLEKHWESLKDKNVIVVAVGAAPPDDDQSKKTFELIPAGIRKHIKYYKLPGRFFGINKDKINKDNLSKIIKILK